MRARKATKPAGGKAAASHTGSMTGSDDVLEAAFRRSGVLKSNSSSSSMTACPPKSVSVVSASEHATGSTIMLEARLNAMFLRKRSIVLGFGSNATTFPLGPTRTAAGRL